MLPGLSLKIDVQLAQTKVIGHLTVPIACGQSLNHRSGDPRVTLPPPAAPHYGAETTVPAQPPSGEFRTEHDSLGPVYVPIQALYGAQTYRAVENYPISGRTAHPSLVRAYLRIKKAAAQANLEAGVLDASRADLIARAIEEILSTPLNQWSGIFPVDSYQAGAGTSQNMNTNEVVANVANRLAGNPLGSYQPVHPNDHVNRSQSTNDSFPTAMRLAILDESKNLLQSLEDLGQALEHKAGAWSAILKSARTHLQDAVPMTLGQEFSAYAHTVQKAVGWIRSGREALGELGIGGSAAGTGLTVPKTYAPRMVHLLSEATKERLRLSPSLCEAMQSQSPVTYYSAMLKVTGIEITRICNDLRLMASGPMTGLAELLLPAVQPGSSIMPGKVNPSIIEMVNQSWYSVLGYEQTIAYCGQAGQLELNVMMPMMAYSAIEATRVGAHSLRILRTRCIEDLEPNQERLTQYFESTPQIATALSPALGYEKTAQLVHEALELKVTVVSLIRDRKLIEPEQLAALLDPKLLTGQA